MQECNRCSRTPCVIGKRLNLIRKALRYKRKHENLHPTREEMIQSCHREIDPPPLKVSIIDRIVFNQPEEASDILTRLNVQVDRFRIGKGEQQQ